MAMTTIDRAVLTHQPYFHDRAAPEATVVVPSVLVAVRWLGGRLLLVRRCGSGLWELPGGRVHVGENAVEAAVRKTAAESGVRVLVTGLEGLFTDPGHVVRSIHGEVGQSFAVLLRARWIGGEPRGDQRGTSDARWVSPADMSGLALEPSTRRCVAQALTVGEPPCLR